MSAKYRGKHNGLTRGSYVRKAFIYTPKELSRISESEKQLRDFLGGIAYCVGTSQVDNDEYSYEFRAYHMAGATIGVSIMDFYKHPDSGHPFYYVQLYFVSNDGLEDVIKKVTETFPDFKEIDPDNRRP